MREAYKVYGWDLPFGKIVLIWREGCIIRAKFFTKIKKAFDNNLDLTNLLLDPYFHSIVVSHHKAWRDVVAQAVK